MDKRLTGKYALPNRETTFLLGALSTFEEGVVNTYIIARPQSFITQSLPAYY